METFSVLLDLWEEFTGHRWISLTKASDEQTAEQTIETQVMWDSLIMTSL